MTHTDLIDKGPVNIGEAAKASSVSAEMIRYYENIGLLPPSPRTKGSHRMYDVWTLHVLRFIHKSRSLGFTLEEIRTLLSLWNDRERTSVDVKTVALRHVVDPDTRISELQTMHDMLMTLASACHGDSHLDCPILQSVAGKDSEGGPESDLDTCYHWRATLSAQVATGGVYATTWQPKEETPMTQALAQITTRQALETRQRMKDGTKLLVRTWLLAPNIGEPRGAVILVRGMAERSDRYPHMAKVLIDLDLRVRAFGLRGYGKNGGPHMALDVQDDYLTDLAGIVDTAVAEWYEMPFVLGHSMGGLIVARFTTARIRPMRGVLLSSPALRVKLPPGTGIVRGLLSALAPELAIPDPVSPAKLSHDPSVAAAYWADPLVQGTINASLLEFMLSVITQTQQDAPCLEAPMLLMAGDADSIIDPSGSRNFYANAPKDLQTLAWSGNRYHEIFNEAEPLRSEMFGKVTERLASRIWFEMNWLHHNNKNQ